MSPSFLVSARATAFWICAAFLAFVTLWSLWGMMGPFVGGVLIAYLLRPACHMVERAGLSRSAAATTTVVGFSVCVIAAVAFVVPFVWSQAQDLILSLPAMSTKASAMLHARWDTLREHLDPETVAQAEAATSSYLGSALDAVGGLVKGAAAKGFALVDVGTFAVIAPLIAFYVLSDWDRIVDWVDGSLPRTVEAGIRRNVVEIDRTLSAWIRWEAVVCISLALFYSAALTLSGLRNGFLIGLLTGLFAFVPYVGFLCGLIAACIVGIFSFVGWHGWAAIGVTFTVGQILDGYILTPRLVGRKIGLHDVWVIFALMAGSHLMGFMGVVIAVPGAAVIGVLLRSAMSRYRTSTFFSGDTQDQ